MLILTPALYDEDRWVARVGRMDAPGGRAGGRQPHADEAPLLCPLVPLVFLSLPCGTPQRRQDEAASL